MLGLGRRLAAIVLRAALMIFAAATFTFFLVRLMPGNPVQTAYQQLLTKGDTPDQARRITQSMYGYLPHGNLFSQYWNYLGQLVHLNLGSSVSSQGVAVSAELRSAVGWTIGLVLAGVIISAVLGVVLGVIAAMRRSTVVGEGLSVLGSLLHGIPQYVMALVLVTFFTVKFPIFQTGPVDGLLEPGLNGPYIASVLTHAVLPASAFALSSFGGYLLTMKASVISVLGDDFILAAELRGLTKGLIFRYIARNALLPLFTILALSFGFMFGGALFIEDAFGYPGMGELLINAVGARDYPLMSGAFLVITVAVILANVLSDALYSVIDPRVRRGGAAA